MPSYWIALQPDHRSHAFSITELSVTLCILSLLSVVSMAAVVKPLRDHQFGTFAALMCADFQRALTQAQVSYRPLRMNFNHGPEAFYRLETQVDGQWLTLSLPIKLTGYQRSISLSVPDHRPHPHHPHRPLDTAFRSSHAPYFYFKRVGSSSGTLAFSDRAGRTLCFILAGENNRLRAYLWLPGFDQWRSIL